MSVEFDYTAAGVSLPIKGTNRSIEFIDKLARDYNATGVHFLGETETALEDGSTDSEIEINGEMHTSRNGDIVAFISHEFIYSEKSGSWHEIGNVSDLGSLALLNYAYIDYTPEGTVVNPEINLNVNESAYVVNSVEDAGEVTIGTPDSMSMSVDEDGILSIGFTESIPTVVNLPHFTKQNIATGVEEITPAIFYGTTSNLEAR